MRKRRRRRRRRRRILFFVGPGKGENAAPGKCTYSVTLPSLPSLPRLL